MARPPDRSSAQQFKTQSYTKSWAANNPYYAPHVTWSFDTFDTTYAGAGSSADWGPASKSSALYSGVVYRAGHHNVHPEERGYSAKNMYNWAHPMRRGTPYDRFGNVQKQKGDVNLGLVLMAGYQFPGQAFAPSPAPGGSGLWGANPLARWMNTRGYGGYSPSGLRYRRTGERWRDRGWEGTLSHATSSHKGPGGYGQSSEDSTIERYSTQETRLGTRATFTDEEFDEDTKKYGRRWAGWRPLSTHSSNPYFDSKLSRMYKKENTDIGYARRVQRSG